MSDSLDQAKDGIETAHHAHHEGYTSARKIAILISVLAAMLAIAEMAEKSAQNDYMTSHITLSDDWAFYQAKTVRWDTLHALTDVLQSLPNANDPAISARTERLRTEAARMNDDEASRGRKQLQIMAQRQTELRDHAFHRYHHFELVVGALQIAIVLASVSVVTRVDAMWIGAAAIGGLSAIFGLLVGFNFL